MQRRNFVKGVLGSIGAAQLLTFASPIAFAQAAAVTGTAAPLKINLSSAGRLGFYVDYSELNSAGTHTFYVCRTHGTEGQVSVQYSTGGDPHNAVSGSLTWADGEADVKAFDVTVASKTIAGDHRIWAKLSNPNGGAALHFGDNHTVAYGVIDDATVASDDAAIFYDANSSVNGNGTRSAPYNDLHIAIANTSAKRYLYGKGVTIVDDSYTTELAGWSGLYMLPAPSSRSGENSRLYVRNWPGYEWTVSGLGSSMRAGFYAKSGESFHTYRGIKFSDLDASAIANGFGVFYHYGGSTSINVELCSAENINGRSGMNNGAYMLWGVDGGKVWRSSATNIQTAGSNTNQNTSGVFTYEGKNLSVQRCDVSRAASLVYHKKTATGDTSTSVRFSIDDTYYGVMYGASGSGGVSHSYTIVQGNLFKNNGRTAIYHWPGSDGRNGDNSGEKHWWCNNVFLGRGAGETAAITFRQGYKAAIFNNIMLNCRKMWADFTDSTAFGTGVEYADYNLDQGTTLTSQRYEWKGLNFNSADSLFSSSGLARHDNYGDPLFGSDYRLETGSPALSGGIGGAQQGVYLVGVEVIGPIGIMEKPANANLKSAPNSPTLTVTIIPE